MSLGEYIVASKEYYFKSRSPTFFLCLFLIGLGGMFLLASIIPIWSQKYERRNEAYNKSYLHYTEKCNNLPTHPTTNYEQTHILGCEEALLTQWKPVLLASLYDVLMFLVIMPVFYVVTAILSPFVIILYPFLRLGELVEDSFKLWGVFVPPFITFLPAIIPILVGYMLFEWFKQGVPALVRWAVTRRVDTPNWSACAADKNIQKQEFLLTPNETLLKF